MTITAEPSVSLGESEPSVSLGENLCRLIQADPLSASTVTLTNREVLYRHPNAARYVYVVQRGRLKAVVTSREGKECLLGIYQPGDVFGLSSLFGGDLGETMVAMGSSALSRITSAHVMTALADDGLRDRVLRYFAVRLTEQQQLITDLVTADSEHRLAAVLLHLARKLGVRRANGLRMDERITQEELASMVGTTRSRVGLFLKRFQHAGLVAQPGGCFLVVNEDGMERFLAGEPRPRRHTAVAAD